MHHDSIISTSLLILPPSQPASAVLLDCFFAHLWQSAHVHASHPAYTPRTASSLCDRSKPSVAAASLSVSHPRFLGRVQILASPSGPPVDPSTPCHLHIAIHYQPVIPPPPYRLATAVRRTSPPIPCILSSVPHTTPSMAVDKSSCQ
jgi:hypothetical protein